MSRSIVIVFEHRSRWTPELQRQFSEEGIDVRGCRSIADIRPILDTNRQAVVVLDFEASSAECLQYLGQHVNQPGMPPIVVIASQQTAHLEWSTRELGAVEFVIGQIPGHEMARLCRCLLKSQPSTSTLASLAIQ